MLIITCTPLVFLYINKDSLTDTVLNYSLADSTTCPNIYDNMTFL